MTIIYLDQNKWIECARVWHGRERDADIQAMLNLLIQGVDGRSLLLPLSQVHFIETARARPNRRRRLAEIMWPLSRGTTMAGYSEITRHEIRVSLSRRFPEVESGELQLLGTGWHHAFGYPAPALTIATDYLAREKFLDHEVARQVLSDLIDGFILAGVDPDGNSIGSYRDDTHATRFENHLRRLRPALTNLSEDRWEDALYAVSLMDVTDPILEVLSASGLEWSQFMALGAEGLGVFLEEMPLRRADLHLHRQFRSNAQLQPKPSDMNDWSGLIPAAMYSDVLVCEKHFADLLLRDGFQPRAQVLTDLRDVPQVLTVLSR